MPETTSTQAANTNAQAAAQPGYLARARNFVSDLADKTPSWLKYALVSTATTIPVLYVNNNWPLQGLSNLNMQGTPIVRDVNGDGRGDVIVNRYIGANSTYLTNPDGTTTLESRVR